MISLSDALPFVAIVVVGLVVWLLRQYAPLWAMRALFVVAAATMLFWPSSSGQRGRGVAVLMVLLGIATLFGPAAKTAYRRDRPHS